MQQPVRNIPEDHAEIAERIRSGEFFRESRTMYDFGVHDPMVERYLYVLITSIAILILMVAIFAARGLYPLQRSVPFIVSSNNVVEDLPLIKTIIAYKGESASDAVLRFVVENYVTLREEYNIENFDRGVNGIKSQSTADVFQEFQKQIDPRNPESPITLYQRHSRRTISILSSKLLPENAGMEVAFEATVESKTEIKKSRWQADIAFNYTGVTIDQDTGQVTPPEFIVTQYRVKRPQDIK